MATGWNTEDRDDAPNPYAPPTSKPERAPSRVGKRLVRCEFGAIFEATWDLFRERLGACLGVCWTAVGLMWITSYVEQVVRRDVLSPADPVVYFVAAFALFFGGYVLNVWLSIGQNLALLALARRRRSVFEELFRGGPFLLAMILASLLVGLAVALIVLVNLAIVPIFSGAFESPAVGLLVTVLVAIALSVATAGYVGLRLSQFHFLIFDRHAGVVDSLRWSWQVTRGAVGTLLLVYVMAGLINLAGLLCCFVGLVFTIPLTNLMLAVTYLAVTGQPLSEDEPDEYWLADDEVGP